MSIASTDIVWRKAAVNDDTGGNGGRMVSTSIPSDVKNNIWPDVRQAERLAGSTKYRKVFIHIANSQSLQLIAPKFFVETNTPGDDSVTFFPGTQTDTQSGITGAERQYGCGRLNADAIATDTSIDVLTEDAALNYIRVGDSIRISDKTTVDAVSGNEQIVTVTAVSYTGDVASVDFTEPLDYGFAALTTKVASLYEPADIAATATAPVVTSVAGTYDNGTSPIVPSGIGTVEQDWTLTFTSATEFGVVGNTLGSVGAGVISSNFVPAHPVLFSPYFTIPAAAWGGTFDAGDTITFTTHPASVPLWYKRVVPAGASSLSGNKAIIAVEGESE